MEKKISEKIGQMGKVVEKMKEDLKKMNETLEDLEATMLEAREELNKGLDTVPGDGEKRIRKVDENPCGKICEKGCSGENFELEDAMSCLKLQEALKDPPHAASSGPVLNQRPKRVIKPNPRYQD